MLVFLGLGGTVNANYHKCLTDKIYKDYKIGIIIYRGNEGLPFKTP